MAQLCDYLKMLNLCGHDEQNLPPIVGCLQLFKVRFLCICKSEGLRKTNLSGKDIKYFEYSEEFCGLLSRC